MNVGAVNLLVSAYFAFSAYVHPFCIHEHSHWLENEVETETPVSSVLSEVLDHFSFSLFSAKQKTVLAAEK